jgi:pimeloyl-ACP methyl ester carboxylesterase
LHERDVTFTAAGHRLAGTLCTPDEAGPHPAALLLPGSGPLDRNGNHRRMPLDVSRQLAHALAAAGVATLRYDKRGVGASPGDWRAAGFLDNVADADAALTYLADLPDTRAERLFLVGHSEGAVVATALAARRPTLAGVVLLCGAARTGEQVLLWQAEQIVPTLPLLVRAVLGLLRADPVRKVAANHAKIKATTSDVARLNGVKTNARWFREYMAYDPTVDLRKIAAPVLAITGTKDLQVSPDDLAVIEATAAGPVTTTLVKDLTHTLRRQHRDPSLRRYREEIKRPIDTELLDVLTRWVTAQPALASRNDHAEPGAP